jgi:hypothetical protein
MFRIIWLLVQRCSIKFNEPELTEFDKFTTNCVINSN